MDTKRILATWIFNRAYLIPSFFALSSFFELFDLQTKVVITEKIEKRDINILKSVGPIEIIQYECAHKRPIHRYYEEHMINRLARMDVLEKFSVFAKDVMLIDSDIVFAPGANEILFEIREHLQQNKPSVLGVIEHNEAKNSEFYFAKKDENGKRNPKLNYDARVMAWQYVFGENWDSLLSGKAFNNGLLFFRDSKDLAKTWRRYYLRGLNSDSVNFEDDQVPLSAAITKTNCSAIGLDSKYNSLGKINGDHKVFHAYAGNWKWELKKLIDGQKPESIYASIANKYLSKIPPHWIEDFHRNLDVYMRRVQALQAAED